MKILASPLLQPFKKQKSIETKRKLQIKEA